MREKTRFLIRASYLEVYNEMVRDLLGGNVSKALDLREDPDRGVYVKDLTLHEVKDSASLITLMAKGTGNRQVGATAMNADSSRSHSIFTVWVEMCEVDDEGNDRIKAGKLNLVDLAGSERQSKTQAEGARLKEATKINLSLSALGNVISALVDGKAKHIPYRDSKLTRLLQDSLGGNTKTLMIAALSPADNNYDETLSTLRYANRAKNIKNKAVINEDPKDALLRQYAEEIEALKKMLAGQLGVDDLSKMLNPAAEEPGGRQRASQQAAPAPAGVNEEELRSKYEQEKASEIASMEKRLKGEYDSKLAVLEDKLMNSTGGDDVQLQEEYDQLTKEYENRRASVEISVQEDMQSAGSSPTKADAASSDGGMRNITTQGRPATVIGPDGNPVVALVDDNGTFIKATVSEDGQLRPLMDSNNQTVPVMGPNGQGAEEITSDVGSGGASTAGVVMRFVPTTVIGPNGNPTAALVGPDGRAVKAIINETGELEPFMDADQNYVYIEGPSGESAAEVKVPAAPVTVLGPDGTMTVAVYDENGQAVRAELGLEGTMQPVRDKQGRTQAVGNEKVRSMLHAQPIIETLSVNTPVVVTGADNKPTVGLMRPDGTVVKGEVKGTTLHMATDRKGCSIPLKGPNKQPARRFTATSTPVACLDPSGQLMIAVVGPDGMLCKAELDSERQVHMALGADRNPIMLTGPGGGPAKEVLSGAVLSTGENIAVQRTAVAINETGQLAVALEGPDGIPIHAILGANGTLEPDYDSNGRLKPVPGPSGTVEKVTVSEAPVAVLNKMGEVTYAVVGTDGVILAPTLGPDGQLHAQNDSNGWPLEMEDAILLGASTQILTQSMPKLVAVIGKHGQPVPALIGPDGQPIEAQVSDSGQVEAVRGADGKLRIVEGPTGTTAKMLDAPNAPRVVAGKAGDEAVVSVQNSDGALVRAELDGNGQLKGTREIVGTASDAVDKVKQVTVASAEAGPVVVVNEDGEAVPAVLDKDGTHFRVGLNKFGQLEAVRDAQGKKIRLSAQGGPAPSLKTIVEEHEVEPATTPEHRGSAMSPEQDELAAQLRAKLALLQGTTVGGEEEGQVANVRRKEELKKELLSKREKAEKRRLERLKKASERAEDDGIIEETFTSQAEEIKRNREKVKRAKQLLRAQKVEIQDLKSEFESEREFMLEDLRKQNQLIKYQQSLLERVQPLIRRDCNYSNFDKIRKESVWDDEQQDWAMPKITTNGNSAMPVVSPGVGVERGRARLPRGCVRGACLQCEDAPPFAPSRVPVSEIVPPCDHVNNVIMQPELREPAAGTHLGVAHLVDCPVRTSHTRAVQETGTRA